jgi:orotate phosphoribosyltransferase
MAAEIRELLTSTGALLHGHFRLSSGLHSADYVQCALLLEHPRNARAIGQALGERLRHLAPSGIAAPALGGLVIGYAVAEALDLRMIFTERKEGQVMLRRGFRVAPGERLIIVEDVVTTGKSTRETAAVVEARGAVVVGYGSILNRSGVQNPFDAPYESLLSLSFETWPASECPLCGRGLALDSPGSRYSGSPSA